MMPSGTESPASTPNMRNRNRDRDRDLKRSSVQPGEQTPTSSGSLPILPSEDIMFEDKVIHDTKFHNLPANRNYYGEDDDDGEEEEEEEEEEETTEVPTILTEERATLSRIAPFLSKQRSQLWLPLALAMSFALVLLILRTTMVDTPMLSPEQISFTNWLSPFGHNPTTHRIAHTDRRQDSTGAPKENFDELVRQLEDDVREIQQSLSQLGHPHQTRSSSGASPEEVGHGMNSRIHHAESKLKGTFEKGRESVDHLKDKYEGGRMYVRDKLPHIPKDLNAARETYTLDRGEMYLRDKIHHIREEISSLRALRHPPQIPSLYERMVSWFSRNPSQQLPLQPNTMVLTSEPHPYLEPHFLDELHFAREGQVRKDMEAQLAKAKHILREEQEKSKNSGLWTSVLHFFSNADDEMHSDLVSLKENAKDTFKILTPKLRDFLDKHNSPHAKSLLKELEDLEKKGKSYAEESKGHLSRIRDTTNAIINHGLSTLESATGKLIEGKNDVMSKLSPSSSEPSSKEVQPSHSSRSESISLFEESIRHVYNLAREEAEHQAKVMGEYGRHSASSMAEWMRHEREKARIQALAQDKDMSDHHHDAPGLLFDPLAV